MNDDFSLETFNGQAKLFPLPNLVMFPGVIQPLHIFEPRYKEMMHDALDSDRLLAPVLLQPEYEEDYYERPAIHPFACLGQIHQEEELPDGRFNLILQGLARVRIVEELTTEKLYRQAKVELVHEVENVSEKESSIFVKRLRASIAPWFSGGDALKQAQMLFQSDLSLSTLCDIFSFAIPIDHLVKQQLLETPEVRERAELLLIHLNEKQEESDDNERPFPPDFSVN